MLTGVYARIPFRLWAAKWAILSVALPVSAFAQTPAPPSDSNSPLAPVQQRNDQANQYDPLAVDAESQKAREKARREADERVQKEQAPLPGSIADSETPAGRPSSTSAARNVTDQSSTEYAGPAVLTRDSTLGQTQLPKVLRWTEQFGVNTVFDTGLGQIGPSGPASAGTLTGTQLTWSFGGGHSFKRDQIGFATSGGLSYYPDSAFYSGSNHGASAFWSHVITRRISLKTTFSGQITSANSALSGFSAGPGSIANVNLAASPDIGIFDNGSKQGTLGSGLSWQLTNRLSAGLNGSYFGVIRDSPLLTGVSGESAGGDMSYRLTHKMTVGGAYSFNEYVYPHGLQASYVQSYNLIFSYALNRNTQLRFNGGVSRIETQGLQEVTLNPIIALILGQTSTVIDSYQAITSSNISAQVVHDFRRRGTLSLAYARGATPGNGLFQTSMAKNLNVSFSRKLFRTYTFSMSADRSQTAAIGIGAGLYATESARISLSRAAGHGTSVNFSVNYRHYDIATFASLRNQLTLSSGFSWGNANGRLWPF
jgi:hypothetical protein